MLAALLVAANTPGIRETGGIHGIRGVEFQKHWAVVEMFDRLDANPASNELFLFELIQDVAILDHFESPTQLEAFQVKKKEGLGWQWSALSSIATNKKAKAQRSSKFLNSPIGKLFAVLSVLPGHPVSATFVSNAPCTFSLLGGTSASTKSHLTLAELEAGIASGLAQALSNAGISVGHDKVSIRRTDIPPSRPTPFLTGIVADYLDRHCPQHIGQAAAIASALLAKVATLSMRAQLVTSFDEARQKCGYSLPQLRDALSAHIAKPTVSSVTDQIIDDLRTGGAGIQTLTRIRQGLADMAMARINGSVPRESVLLAIEISSWLAGIEIDPVNQTLVACSTALRPSFSLLSESQFLAHVVEGMARKCVDQA